MSPATVALGVEEQVSAEAVVLPLVIAPRKEKFASDCAEIARAWDGTT